MSADLIPLQSLDDAVSPDPLMAGDYLQNTEVLEAALKKLGVKKDTSSSFLPQYYDDMLSRLIDAVPLE